jgi:hypothetical protein
VEAMVVGPAGARVAEGDARRVRLTVDRSADLEKVLTEARSTAESLSRAPGRSALGAWFPPRCQARQADSPLTRPRGLVRDELVLLGHQETSGSMATSKPCARSSRADPLGCPAGERGRPFHPGVEGRRPGRVMTERVEPLTQPRSGPRQSRRSPSRPTEVGSPGPSDSHLVTCSPGHRLRPAMD